ncbi:hypothetical protein CfE428DRAFT_2889 [Chthoniobacter flavus Ellin428]|uniref:Uncharacterized protein n=1 Tax=Chthoniobacter flavus Ellin428 TaxID=497964 RepID=B4D1V1_9BACT|nr:hypothetical protein CfE428DRAFT_2889 [Chthoniobacter flavus Ellin428]
MAKGLGRYVLWARELVKFLTADFVDDTEGRDPAQLHL